MNEAALRADDAARAAARAPDASILLEAPAGSGKTAVLTQRYLRLLVTVDDPGEILAITFTRKAAAEMRARVVRALRGEVSNDDTEAQLLRTLAGAALAHGAARGWRLDSEPQSLRIQTIDSFNYWLASQLPVASRAGGALNVTETASELYQRAARRTLLGVEREGAFAADAQLLFERMDNRWLHFEGLIAQMLRERAHWLRFVADGDPQTLCRQVNESLADLARARLGELAALIPPALLQRARALPGVGILGIDAVDIVQWKALARLLLTKDDWRKQVDRRMGEPFADRGLCHRLRELIDELRALGGAREALLELRHAPGAQLTSADADALQALSRVLKRAASELQLEFADSGRVDYTYIAGAAREALTEDGEPTDLALRAGLKLRHILVDEFQDTSLAQFQLLEALTIGWEEGDGRTLFLVGDPMQSIYRFRDAQVGLFLRALHAGIGRVALEPLRLARNFRSSAALVEFVNDIGPQVFAPADELRAGAVSYRASVAARAARGVLPLIAPVTERLFPDARAAEARAIATHVAHLRRLDPRGTAAVLVAAHAHAVPIIAALEEAQLPVLAVDVVPLAGRLVVRDLVQLTRALHDLADRAAWLAVLRAPWCGARLTTLSALSHANDRLLLIEALEEPQRLARCDPAEAARLARVHQVLRSALAERAGSALVDWVERTWMRLGASDAYRADELDDGRSFLAALAERVASFGWRGPDDLPGLLERLYSTPPAGDNPVQVMTIHRAKGLEFDHVIIPALERVTRSAERRLLRCVDLPGVARETDLLIAPDPPVGSMYEEGDLHGYLRRLGKERDRNERCRLLYVALTRARQSLWLSGAPQTSADGTVRPDPRSLLALLWPALALRFQHGAAEERPAHASPAPAPLRRLVPGWQAAALPPPVLVRQLPRAHLEAEPPEFSWVGETQRHIGTLVHAWLERLSRGRELPAPDALDGQREAVVAQLRRTGTPENEQGDALQTILDAIRRTLADERGRWILSCSHRDAHSEWELSGVSGGRLRDVKVDRTFVDERGTRWVIDYKTSLHEGGDLEGFLEREMQRYRPQLEGYRGLAAALGPEPVRAALYFPLLGAFRELA